MEYVRKRRRVFFAIAAVALVLIVVVSQGKYGGLQMAKDATVFHSLASTDTWRYVAAGLIDLVFAAAYGLAALGMPSTPRASRVGAWLVALGAVADEAENVTLLVGVSQRASITNGAVDLMRAFGTAKLGAILLGLLLLYAGLVQRRWARIEAWVEMSWKWYAAFVGVLAMMVVLASLRLHGRSLWVMVLSLLALAYVGSRLNGVVRDDRANPPPGGDHGFARAILATGQLGIGAVLAVAGYRSQGPVADMAFFLGLAFVVMSIGAYVSELRWTSLLRPARGVLLVLGSLGVLAIAAMSGRSSALTLVIVGVVAGQIGTELLSADFLRWSPPFPNWVVGAFGGLVLLVGASLFVAAGVDPGHAVPVIAALAVIVFFASADGDALIIVFLIAYALVWATSPVDAKIDDARQPKAGEQYFVVFGDSYISGEGAETFIEGTNEKVHDAEPDATHENECRRATTAWPFVVAETAAEKKSTTIPSRVLFLGCSGAITENIHTLPRKDSKGTQHGPAELDRFLDEKKALGLGDPAFVLLSIGGNDAGFGDIGKTCVAPGNCAEVGEQFLVGREADEKQEVDGEPGMGHAESLADIRDDLDATYKRVRAAVGDDIPVVVAPYPIPLTESGRCRGVLLDADERRFIRGFVPQLNGVIRDMATRNGFHVLEPMQDALRGTGAQLCSKVGGKAGLNFLALNPTSGSLADSISPKNWVHNSLHPNAAGHDAIAARAYDWLSKNLSNDPPEHVAHPIAPIGEVLDGAFVTQCKPADRATCVVDRGVWVGEQVYDFFARSLFPLAVVMFGLWLCINPMLRWGGSRTPPVSVAWLLWPGARYVGEKAWGAVQWLRGGP